MNIRWLASFAVALGGLLVHTPMAIASDGYGLQNVRHETIQGERDLGGGCRFHPPKLELGIHERAKGRREIATDYETCTVLLEVGTPTPDALTALLTDPIALNGSSRSEEPKASEGLSDTGKTGPDPAPPCCEHGAYGSGYYKIQWEDRWDIDVTKTYAFLNWTWNGTCVDWWDGRPDQWHRSSTGWSLAGYDWGMWFAGGCNVIVSATDTVFHHGGAPFCSGNDVWISIYDAQAYGNQWGEFGGGFWYNQSNQCDPGPNLHWRDWVVRTG